MFEVIAIVLVVVWYVLKRRKKARQLNGIANTLGVGRSGPRNDGRTSL